MKYTVSALDAELLDAAVAIAEGYVRHENGRYHRPPEMIHGTPMERYVCPGNARDESGLPVIGRFHPSGDWSHGGPIIERERMRSSEYEAELYPGQRWHYWTPSGHTGHGPTPLIAAMRAYVVQKLGPEIDLP